jgi:hypothetical protein
VTIEYNVRVESRHNSEPFELRLLTISRDNPTASLPDDSGVPAMEQHELLNTLKAVHAQLNQSGEIDPETQRLLQTVTADIQKALDAKSGAEGSDDSLAERIRTSLIEFEVRHPTLGGLLESMTDGLSSIGI